MVVKKTLILIFPFLYEGSIRLGHIQSSPFQFQIIGNSLFELGRNTA